LITGFTKEDLNYWKTIKVNRNYLLTGILVQVILKIKGQDRNPALLIIPISYEKPKNVDCCL
jgi:hypothetical protein